MTALFALTMFASGTLIFLVQPMFARMLLPLFGGAPAVWNTAMVCYQLLLLAGYLYAHLSTRWLSVSRQVVLHLLVVVLPFVLLPMAVPHGWHALAGSDPVPRLMAMLLLGAGLPFFVLATTSPMLQVWFAQSVRRSGSDPYLLYAASNAGSMLALLSYPLLIEPRLSLPQQSGAWSLGYAGFVLLLVACATLAWRGSRRLPHPATRNSAPDMAAAQVSWRRRARWVLLAFVPSSLMLGVTMHLSTNIAPFPLLWVLPLALYLLSFILAFATRRMMPLPLLTRALPIAIVPLLVAILADVTQPVRAVVALHLVAFGIIALVSHATLADDAPPAAALTGFYLWLSVGGALGGVFNALVAPLIFTSILEYPVVLVLAAFSLPVVIDGADEAVATGQARWAAVAPRHALDVLLPLCLIPMIVICDVVTREFGLDSVAARRVLALGAPAMICYALAGRQVRFGFAVAALLAGSTVFERNRHLLVAERSFFGVTRVYATGDGSYHALVHGNISHGAQSTAPTRRREPLSYYTRSGPIGELIIPRQRLGLVRRVAVVGLGAGSLACYRQPAEQWTFFEIDAAVVRIARDARFFSYLSDCAPDAPVVVGDARQSLRDVPDDAFDLMLMDAYSADAIPVHLLTREALALYRRKLAPGGVIALHISNQYFRLAPVIAALAADAGMVARLRDEKFLTTTEAARGKSTSDWMVLAERDADLATLLSLPRWERVAPAGRVWTDDFSSLLSAMR